MVLQENENWQDIPVYVYQNKWANRYCDNRVATEPGDKCDYSVGVGFDFYPKYSFMSGLRRRMAFRTRVGAMNGWEKEWKRKDLQPKNSNK